MNEERAAWIDLLSVYGEWRAAREMAIADRERGAGDSGYVSEMAEKVEVAKRKLIGMGVDADALEGTIE